LIKHQELLDKNPRTRLMTVNLKRLSDSEKADIKSHAQTLLSNLNAV
jgi:deoxyribodipyrimidine photolyase-like uncharacterized protein